MNQLTLDDPSPPIDIDELDSGLADLVCQFGHALVMERLRAASPAPVPSAPARHTDPETSHAAGPRSQDVGRFSAKSRQAKLLHIFSQRDMTDQQATIALVGSHAVPSAFDGCRRRCSDLRAAGYLRDSGGRRKNAGSDDLSVVWRITVAGRDAVTSLDKTGWSR